MFENALTEQYYWGLRRQFWSQPQSWPVDLPGYIFAARAVLKLGRKRFPEQWQEDDPITDPPSCLPETLSVYTSSADMLRASSLLNHHCPNYRNSGTVPRISGGSAEIPSPTHWLRARELAAEEAERGNKKLLRYLSVAIELGKKIQIGSVVSALRDHEGGALESCDVALWYMEFADLRFDTCCIDLNQPFKIVWPGPETRWVYVEEESFISILTERSVEAGSDDVSGDAARLARQRRGPGRPPQYKWDQFTAEILRRVRDGSLLLDEMDRISEDLVAEMLQWCENEWGGQPSRSTVRDKLAIFFHKVISD